MHILNSTQGSRAAILAGWRRLSGLRRREHHGAQPWNGRVLGAIALALLTRSACAGLPALPVEQWRWNAREDPSNLQYAQGTCLVIQFTDDDGDGRIDERDDPDVLIPHRGSFTDTWALRIVDGASGGLHRTIDAWPFTPEVMSAGDVDGDGRPEIVTTDGVDVLGVRDDGTLSWRRAIPEWLNGGAAFNLADIDLDGRMDVVSGRLAWLGNGTSWVGLGGRGRHPSSAGPMSVPMDLDPSSPGLEVVAGNTLYDSAGGILWQSGVSDGTPAVADLTGDGEPEIVLVTARDLLLLDRFGSTIGSSLDVFPADTLPVPAVIADLDADGQPEVVVTTIDFVRAFKWTGTAFEVFWSAPVHVIPSFPRPTAFDFDCDGAAEIVYRDEDRWYIFEGRDGSVLHAGDFYSGTVDEMVVVANLDDDPWAEIIIPSQGSTVRVYEVPGSATPRPIFNQPTFHGTNVLDDGTIPTPELPSWRANNTYAAQVAANPIDPCANPCIAPELGAVTVVDPSDCNLGLRVSWPAAAFPSDSGTYNVYRSDDLQGLSCADALSRPPLAEGLTDLSWNDTQTEPGRQYLHVVEAEDGAPAPAGCAPIGPVVGGTVARSCATVATADAGDYVMPAPVGAVLRVAREADEVVLSWPTIRPLLAGEHFHVLRATGSARGPFGRANPEGQLTPEWRESRTAEPLVFYDLRVANGCEDESPADSP